jgi:hypothetical protein
MEIKHTSEAKLRKAFAAAIIELEKSKEESSSMFRFSIVAAAGSLICQILKELDMPKETMDNIMDALWNEEKKRGGEN